MTKKLGLSIKDCYPRFTEKDKHYINTSRLLLIVVEICDLAGFHSFGESNRLGKP